MTEKSSMKSSQKLRQMQHHITAIQPMIITKIQEVIQRVVMTVVFTKKF